MLLLAGDEEECELFAWKARHILRSCPMHPDCATSLCEPAYSVGEQQTLGTLMLSISTKGCSWQILMLRS